MTKPTDGKDFAMFTRKGNAAVRAMVDKALALPEVTPAALFTVLKDGMQKIYDDGHYEVRDTTVREYIVIFIGEAIDKDIGHWSAPMFFFSDTPTTFDRTTQRNPRSLNVA